MRIRDWLADAIGAVVLVFGLPWCLLFLGSLFDRGM